MAKSAVHMMPTAEPVRLEGVCKRYGATEALSDVDLAVAPGEVLALLGRNGAGKTTAVRLVTGSTRPSAGTVRIFGRDPAVHVARQQFGVMCQETWFPHGVSVEELLIRFQNYYDNAGPARRELVELVGLEGLERQGIEKLSASEVQRLKLALAIAGDPRLVVLDEPTAGMGIASRHACWQLIEMLSETGCAVLMTTHHLEEVEQLADRVVLLEQGRIVAFGTPAYTRAYVNIRRSEAAMGI